MKEVFCRLIFGLSVLALGCEASSQSIQPYSKEAAPSSSDSANGNATPFPSNGVNGNDMSPPTNTRTQCPLVYSTEPCTCDNNGQIEQGRRTCTDLGWTRCECAPMKETLNPPELRTNENDPDDNKGPASFHWKRTVPTGGECKAGYYEGVFGGLYNSQALLTATLYIYGTIPVLGDVRFNIEEKPGSGGEFFTVSDGHFTGSAMGMFPFDGDFYGELDCSTKSFTGTLENCYYMVGLDKYAFQGIAVSNYDPINHTYVGGMWSVTEPVGEAIFDSPTNPDAGYPDDGEFPVPLPIQAGVPFGDFFPPGFEGGAGDWNAIWVRDVP